MGAGHSHPLHVHGHSGLHQMAPHVKLLALCAYAVAVATTPPGAWPAFTALALLAAVAVVASGLPLGFVASRALIVTPFLVSAMVIPFAASGHDTSLGPLSWSSVGVVTGLSIAMRALLGVVASIVVAGTTELPRLLAGLERLRVPAAITAIASFMLRYLELVAGELERMHAAMTARGHDPRWLGQVRPMAMASGALFVRTYERGERVHLAMVARGFTGHLPRLHEDVATARQWLVAGTWSALAVAVAVSARVIQ